MSEKNFKPMPYEHYILSCEIAKKLGPTAAWLWVWLYGRSNFDFEVSVPEKLIAQDSGIARRTVTKFLASLTREGLLQRKAGRNHGGQYETNVYVVVHQTPTLPTAPDAQLPDAKFAHSGFFALVFDPGYGSDFPSHGAHASSLARGSKAREEFKRMENNQEPTPTPRAKATPKPAPAMVAFNPAGDHARLRTKDGYPAPKDIDDWSNAERLKFLSRTHWGRSPYPSVVDARKLGQHMCQRHGCNRPVENDQTLWCMGHNDPDFGALE
jgi:hypothetical protein